MFIISLDFELHWGGFEKWPLDVYTPYFQNTRKTIPRMLDAFARHDVHVTWAAVGILLHQTRESMLRCAPSQRPTYLNEAYSAYKFMEQPGIGDSEEADPFHYGHSLVRRILETPGQELGTHTFAHYYCNEAGQTVEQFRADLKAAQCSAKLHDRTLRSLVFPRNQFNKEYLKVCYEEGIRAVRDNPRDWFWQIGSAENEPFLKRLSRGMDAYVPVGKKTSFPLSSIAVEEGLPDRIPASRLLRPYRPKEGFLNTMKIRRICAEMEDAARNNEVYHLWWHPHNFGWYPEESLKGLEAILNQYNRCAKEYGMKSCSMGEAADAVNELHGAPATA